MKLWFILIITLIVQELVTTNAVLLDAYHKNYNIWIITLIFILATTIGISVGYFLGTWVQKKFSNTKAVAYTQKRAKEIEGVLGTSGRRLTLIFLSIINLNYANAFLASWIDLSFSEIFICLFIGDMIWYAMEWSLILGISTFVNPYYAIYFVLGISILLSICVTLINRKLFRRK